MRLPERESDGTYPSYAFPGGYPLVYYTRDGMTICADCASKEVDYSQEAIAYDVYWEGPAIVCDDCGVEIESAYGDPDEEED